MQVTTIDEEFEMNNGRLSALNEVVAAPQFVDTKSIPNEFSSKDKNQTITSHFAKVEIIDGNGQVSSIAMARLLSSTTVPTAEILYPSTTEHHFDSGSSLLKVQGLIYESKELLPSKLYILYPIPLSGNLRIIYFSLPSTVIGDIVLHSIRKSFHISNLVNDFNSGGTFESSNMFTKKWIPEMMSTSFFMASLPVNNILLTSFDEFAHINTDEINVSDEVRCSDHDEFVIQFQKRILYMSKAGLFLVTSDSKNNWKPLKNSIIFDDSAIDICLKRAVVAPPSYSRDILIVSTTNKLYGSTSMNSNDTESVLFMKELIDINGNNVCWTASLNKSDCVIVGQAFDGSACCGLFVLLQSKSTSVFTLIKYEDSTVDGKWKRLFTMSNKLPNIVENKDKLFFITEEYNTGQSFEITGISTLTRPDGTLYIWGNVLLVFDIRSGLLAWVHSYSIGQSLRDPAIQFSSSNNKGVYSILTMKGAVWVGSASPFEKHISNILTRLVGVDGKSYAAVYFDSMDVLCGLTYEVTNANKYLFKRVEIQMHSHSTSNLEQCSRLFNCPRLSLECEAKSSVFHINHTLYSRTRHFFIRPPQLMPKAHENPYFHPLHNKTSFITFLAVKQRFFSGQKINQSQWWKEENDYIRARESYKLNKWWYTHDQQLREYLKFLAMADFLPNDPMLYLNEDQYLHETSRSLGKHESWNIDMCALPSVIYLDKNQEFRFNITIEHALSANIFVLEDLRLVTVISNNDVIDITTIKKQTTFSILYMVVITGKETQHKPPGKHLTSVSASFYPWNPPPTTSQYPCCTTVYEGTSYEQNLLVKVGCPPARRLMFDSQRSLEILFNRGRTDNFECLYDVEDDVPCFTTSEFAAAFYVEDLVTGEQSVFDGNYTLQVVAGGIGYLQNVREYNEEEILSFNYRPGDSKSLQSLIWSVLLESSSGDMRDENTGGLIFDAKDPASIVFECRLDSPCGNIPLGTSNPGEFYLQIEVSNKGVDSSTNCDYTMRFMIHLIGIELSPRVHLMLMMLMLTVLFILALMYYSWNFGGGRQFFRKLVGKDDLLYSDSDEEFAEAPPQFRDILNRRLTVGGIPGAALPGGTGHRPSLLIQSLQNEDRGEKRSSLRVHGVLNTRSNTSRASTRTLTLN